MRVLWTDAALNQLEAMRDKRGQQFLSVLDEVFVAHGVVPSTCLAYQGQQISASSAPRPDVDSARPRLATRRREERPDDRENL